MLLSPTEHLLHKSTLPRVGGMVDLSNTEKQIQREIAKMERQKNMPQMKEQQKFLEKQQNKIKEEIYKIESSKQWL